MPLQSALQNYDVGVRDYGTTKWKIVKGAGFLCRRKDNRLEHCVVTAKRHIKTATMTQR